MAMSNPRAQAPEDTKYVPLEDAHEHGYYGYAPGADEDHSVAAVTGGTANVNDVPKSAARKPAAKETDK